MIVTTRRLQDDSIKEISIREIEEIRLTTHIGTHYTLVVISTKRGGAVKFGIPGIVALEVKEEPERLRPYEGLYD